MTDHDLSQRAIHGASRSRQKAALDAAIAALENIATGRNLPLRETNGATARVREAERALASIEELLR